MSTASVSDILINTHRQPPQAAVKANDLIYDGQLIPRLSGAIEAGHRSEFSLLLAMLSDDAIEYTPTTDIPVLDKSEEALRAELQIPKEQQLESDDASYEKGANIAQAFESDGLTGASLQFRLNPDALCYKTHNTQGLPEDLYRNLSPHEQRHLKTAPSPVKNEKELQLYQALNEQRLLATA